MITDVKKTTTSSDSSSTSTAPPPTTHAAASRVSGGDHSPTTSRHEEPVGADHSDVDHEAGEEDSPHLHALANSFAPDDREEKPGDPAADRPPTDLQKTTQTILDNFDKIDNITGGDRDGVISREDLERAASDPNSDPELREAAQHALDENYLNVMDVGNVHTETNGSYAFQVGGKVDRKIDKNDLQAVIDAEKANPQNLTIAKTAAILRDNQELLDTAAGSGGKDGKISTEDLTSVLNNPDASPELKEAVRAVLENKNYAHALDVATGHGTVDGVIATNDLNAAADRGFLTDPSVAQDPRDNKIFQDAALVVAKNFTQFDTAQKGGDPDGRISKTDIEAIVNDENADPALRDAARIFLDNPAALNAIDVGAGRAEVDDNITREDLRGFATAGLDRAYANFQRESKDYERFLAEYGSFIPPDQLKNSPEAQRLEAAHQSLENMSGNFVDMVHDPGFADQFKDMSDDEKQAFFQDLKEVAGTTRGQPLVQKIVEDVAKKGNGERVEGEDPYADWVVSNAVGKTELGSTLDTLMGSTILGIKDPQQAERLIEGFMKGAHGPEALEENAGVVSALRNYASTVSGLPADAELTAAQRAALKESRTALADELKKQRGASSVAFGSLAAAALVFDGASIANHKWGESIGEDVALVSSTVADVADVGVVAAESLAKGAQGLLGRAASEGAVAAGEATAGVLGRAVPILGAVASFSSAIAEWDKDKVGAIADGISGIGFTTIAVAAFVPPPADAGVALAGGIIAGVGGLIKLGDLAADWFSGESAAERAEAEYKEYSRQILSEAYGGNSTKIDAILSLNAQSRQDILDYAKQQNLPQTEVFQAYDHYYDMWQRDGQGKSFQDYLSNLLHPPPPPPTYPAYPTF